MKAVSNDRGVIAAAAMDQRGSLQKALAKEKGGTVGDHDIEEFKSLVTEVLTPHASAILLDPEWGLPASKRRAKNAGLLMAYEKTGYDATAKGRLGDLLDHWSVRRLKEAGADCIKILLYYTPFDPKDVNDQKHGRTALTGSIPPKIVATGPVKENIVTGKDIDLYDLPSPYWNRLDGGRYLLTYGGCVTKDPETGIMNVGIYRGMVSSRDQIPILMWRAQRMGTISPPGRTAAGRRCPDRRGDRLGALARFLRGIAGAQGRVRIRCDGRHSRRAGRTGEMRNRRPLCAGNS